MSKELAKDSELKGDTLCEVKITVAAMCTITDESNRGNGTSILLIPPRFPPNRIDGGREYLAM
jgi:hypothetical protein